MPHSAADPLCAVPWFVVLSQDARVLADISWLARQELVGTHEAGAAALSAAAAASAPAWPSERGCASARGDATGALPTDPYPLGVIRPLWKESRATSAALMTGL